MTTNDSKDDFSCKHSVKEAIRKRLPYVLLSNFVKMTAKSFIYYAWKIKHYVDSRWKEVCSEHRKPGLSK